MPQEIIFWRLKHYLHFIFWQYGVYLEERCQEVIKMDYGL